MLYQPREKTLVTWIGSVFCQAKEWEEICQYECPDLRSLSRRKSGWGALLSPETERSRLV